ncbi:hypothetical protein K523DRAFT_421551 [Schizophyllum commune Tattone D]|nr:hypothetical protein K523DRAFT_421551 [Schizophyllum commune Tattone D]
MPRREGSPMISRTSPSSQRLASAIETARGSPMFMWPGSSMPSICRKCINVLPSQPNAAENGWLNDPRHRLIPPTVLRKCTNPPASSPNAPEIWQLNDSLNVVYSTPRCIASASMYRGPAQCHSDPDSRMYQYLRNKIINAPASLPNAAKTGSLNDFSGIASRPV